ncbi:hypothetical protein ACRRTK_021831 [Alexandromys fortis]
MPSSHFYRKSKAWQTAASPGKVAWRGQKSPSGPSSSCASSWTSLTRPPASKTKTNSSYKPAQDTRLPSSEAACPYGTGYASKTSSPDLQKREASRPPGGSPGHPSSGCT